MVLAITESSLYQFSGENMIRNLLLEYKADRSLISKSQLTLEATITGTDMARTINASEDDSSA